MEKVTAAIIGLGRIGRTHAEVLTKYVEHVELKYAVDVYLNDDMEKWARKLGVPNIIRDPEVCLKDPEVNAVYICTSTDTHSEYIIRAAKAGKHIFCEKPLDSNLERLNEALQEVAKSSVKFQTGFMRRFDKNHKKAKQMIESGKAGKLQLIKLSCRDAIQSPFEYLKVSGGIFFDMMIHDFDMVRFLSDSEVEEVYATGGAYIDKRLEEIPDVDTAVAILRLKSGAIAVIDNGRQCWYGHDQRSEIFCTQGTIQVSNENENTVTLSNKEGVHVPKPLDFFIERYFGAYISEHQAFIESLLHDIPIAVTAQDGVEPIRIAKAAKLSFEQKRPVKMIEIPQ